MEKQEFEKWKPVPTKALIEYITENFHTKLRTQLPEIQQLFEKVSKVHGMHHPELPKTLEIFVGFSNRMLFHILQEEQIIFPMLLTIEQTSKSQDLNNLNLVSPLLAMEMDHDEDFFVMKEIRKLTNNLTPPSNACGSYRKLFAELETYFQDLELHILIENEVLFKRFKLKNVG